MRERLPRGQDLVTCRSSFSWPAQRDRPLATKLDRAPHCEERSAEAISLTIHGPARSDQLGLRHEDAGDSEADDVGEMVACYVRGEPRKGILAGPAASRVATPEISDVEDRRLKRAIGLAKRGKGPPEAKPDDVGPSVAVHVTENSRVLVLARPAASRRACAEDIRRQERCRERPIGLA